MQITCFQYRQQNGKHTTTRKMYRFSRVAGRSNKNNTYRGEVLPVSHFFPRPSPLHLNKMNSTQFSLAQFEPGFSDFKPTESPPFIFVSGGGNQQTTSRDSRFAGFGATGSRLALAPLQLLVDHGPWTFSAREQHASVQNRFGIPFWLTGEFTTHFCRTYFSGWIESDVHRG